MRPIGRTQLIPALISLALCWASPASAYPTMVGNWHVDVYTSDSGERFCMAVASYEVETLMFLASEQGFSIAVQNPNWSIPNTSNYTINLYVDREHISSGRSVSPIETAIRLDVGWDQTAIDRLRRGYDLSIVSDNASFRFELEGTAASISELLRCYFAEIDRSSRNRNPFEPNQRYSTNPFEPSQSRSSDSVAIETGVYYNASRRVESFLFSVDSTIVVYPEEYGQYYNIVGDRVFGSYFEFDETPGQTLDDFAIMASAYIGEGCERYGVENLQIQRKSAIVARRVVCVDEAFLNFVWRTRDRISLLVVNDFDFGAGADSRSEGVSALSEAISVASR